jgi:hypothetical protein
MKGRSDDESPLDTEPEGPEATEINDCVPNSLNRQLQRAGDRTRTGDVQLGKLAFYQLNYARESANKPPFLLLAQVSNPKARR